VALKHSPGAVHCAALRHCTQLPLPSQTPPAQAMERPIGGKPHTPALQVLPLQSLGAVQSPASRQATHCPAPVQ
jgi:hypothetical protein